MSKRGLLVVLSGPSGCGKGTVVRRVLEKSPNTVVSVSMTTRLPRDGEVDGKHYFFCTRAEFEKKIAEGAFLEYAEYAGNYYGTPKAWVEEHRNAGQNVILEIEVQGGKQIIERCPDAVSVFLTSPSMEELERRLRGRGTESEEKIQRRLERAVWELTQVDAYRYLIVNDEVELAADRLIDIMELEAEIKQELEEK